MEVRDAEAGLVDIRVSIAKSVRARRKAAGLTQEQVAKLAHTTQARISKIEHASDGVSIDLAMRVLLVLGGDPKKISKAMK